MCGAVRYTASAENPTLSACHCDMCRRWTGGPLLSVGAVEVKWEGADKLTTFTSSAWAERGFCAVCGSSLFYRLTARGPHEGALHVPLGTLDDPSGLELSVEWFFDKKPAAYTLAGERKRVTEAEVKAMFDGGG